jgi:hypothetical protein
MEFEKSTVPLFPESLDWRLKTLVTKLWHEYSQFSLPLYGFTVSLFRHLMKMTICLVKYKACGKHST